MYAMSGMVSCFSLEQPQLPKVQIHGEGALESVKLFRFQWQNYCTVTGIDKFSEEVQYNVFRNRVSDEVLPIIDCCLDLPSRDSKDPIKILEALEEYIRPCCRNVRLERLIFNRMVQEDNETIDSYLRRIRIQGAKCDFEDPCEMLRDRFIVGLSNESLKMAVINVSTCPSFEEVITFCRNETQKHHSSLESLNNSVNIQPVSSSVESVANRVETRPSNQMPILIPLPKMIKLEERDRTPTFPDSS